ncbi:OmpA family protein [Hyphomicrobium sp. 2TAF46]|uniref:OmpA family protein n=1 Tax=Hyphomicrobium sp. 2TAF46 TaxID=3233019 RepID=UPI003F91E2CC
MTSTRKAILATASLLAVFAAAPTLVRADDQRQPPAGDNNGKDDNSKRHGKDDRGGNDHRQQPGQPGGGQEQNRQDRSWGQKQQGQQQDQQRPQRERPSREFGGGNQPQGNPNAFGNPQKNQPQQGQQQDQQRPQRERPSRDFGGGNQPQGNPNAFGDQQQRNQQQQGQQQDQQRPKRERPSREFGGGNQPQGNPNAFGNPQQKDQQNKPPVVNNPVKAPPPQQQQAEPQPQQQPFNGKPKNLNDQFGGPGNDRNRPDKSKQFGGRDRDHDQAPNPGSNQPPPGRPVIDNPGGGTQPQPPAQTNNFGEPNRPLSPADAKRRFENLREQRKEVKIDGGKGVVIEEPGQRRIFKENNRVVIQHDENERLRRVDPRARFEKGQGGTNVSIIDRPGGFKVYSETDANGQLLRRYRRGPDGRDVIIIDNRRRGGDGIGRGIATGIGIGIGVAAGAAILNSVLDVPPPRVLIPRDKYIVDYERASDDDVYEALSAPPVDDFSDRYTLDEIRATVGLRDRMRRVDLDDITFEFGAWDVDPSQYRKLERIARGMNRIIDRNPNEVFMIEGYTDAVGSVEDNLSLSDRRAESVATVLSEQFQVPFENMTTQGYGKQYLKVPTSAPERLNRRVAVRRITPLLARDGGPPPPPPGGDRPYGDDRRGDNGPYDGPPRDPRY